MYKEGLPEELRSLIERKLRLRRRDMEVQLSAERRNGKNLGERIAESVRSGRLARAFVEDPLEVYKEAAASAARLTREWPMIAWTEIRDLMEKASYEAAESAELNSLVDKYAWAMAQEPFTLLFINPDRLRLAVSHITGRYGIADRAPSDMERHWGLATSLATCTILNTARQAREAVSVAIDEYLLALKPRLPGPDRPQSKSQLISQESVAHCLPNLPKTDNDWLSVIKEVVGGFYKDQGRCPNPAEVWARLRTQPPRSYGIRNDFYKEEEAVRMGTKALNKTSFLARWQRYTKKE